MEALQPIYDTGKMFSETISSDLYTVESVDSARTLFRDYSEKGIFYDCAFDDNKWNTTNERENIGVKFDLSEISYKKYYENSFGIPFQDFRNYVKTYFMFHMGELALASLRSTVNDTKKFIMTDPGKMVDMSDSFVSQSRLTDFLSLIPIREDCPIDMDDLYSDIEAGLDDVASGRQRELPSYSTMFLFEDIMNDFWENEQEQEVRDFFEPLYIFWKVTMIIPTRPTEMLMTSRNCLEKVKRKAGDIYDDSDEYDYYLTLRKDTLKGRNRKVAYRIADDFRNFRTHISAELGKTIESYIQRTDAFSPTDIKTLFVTDPHYRYWGQRKHSDSRYFTYVNMSTVMRYFYKDIITGRYGLHIVPRGVSDVLPPGGIERIYLGDTRHYAMINAIMEGSTPVIAMKLAGQDSIETASHYYSNMENYVKCETYRACRRIMNGKVEYNVSVRKDMPSRDSYVSLSDNSRCYSDKYAAGDYTDCLMATGPHGELSYCPDCEYHRLGNETLFVNDATRYRENITDACTYLKEVVDLYRRGQGDKEGIMRAIQEFQDSSLSYRRYLEEKERTDE